MADVWRTRDWAGRVVVLTEARRAHILTGHRNMAGRLGEIRATVEAPEVVTSDRQRARREILYRRLDVNYVKVVVHFRPVPPNGTWEGEVITAHLIENVDPREDRLWP